MSALDPAEARRLKSSLALMASPVEGERLAAINAAERILAKHGMGFADLAPAILSPPPPPPQSSPEWQRRGPTPVKPQRPHQRRARVLVNCGFDWNERERRFLNDMAWWARPLSEKQENWLNELEAVGRAWRATHGEAV